MSTNNFALDTKRATPALNYIKWLRQAAQAGKGLGAMVRELYSLMFGPGKLQAQEYFMYQLYDDNRYTPEVKRTFVGIAGPTIHSPWPEIVNDKPTLTALMRGLELPVPEMQAIVHPTRNFGSARSLRSRDQVKGFLRHQAKYPIFGKPFDSACSLGTANIHGYNPTDDCLLLSGGQTIRLSDYIDQIETLGFQYQFQTLLKPHPSIIPIIGDRVSTVRMFVLSDREGCELLRASWKIPVGNGADNFWRTGNILAGIDVQTGRIVKTLRRTKDGTEPITEHPVTGASFENLKFPEWDAMREVVLRAAVNLPECYFQGWDVALTDRGPVLVELEGDGGDPIMEQLCFESGLLQGRYKRFIDSAKEIEKEKKAKARARRSQALRENFAQLLRRQNAGAQPATAEIDPQQVQAAFQAETPQAASSSK